MTEETLVGAVAYTANVVPIWEGIREYFAPSDAPMDFVLFSNYERQVEALLAGHIDMAWNTNVAWVRASRRTGGEARALAMRDTDTTFTSVFVAQAGSGWTSLDDLRGRRVVLGSKDSGQARILPIHYLREAGLGPDDYRLEVIDSDVGKHGDTGRSELDALRRVLDDDADVTAIGGPTWALLTKEGAVDDLEVVWTSPEYSHCNFTALPAFDEERAERWVTHLLAMDWEVPEHRRILELEGLRQWVRPHLDGYASLVAAMDEQGISDRW
jgi:ABC-type phosphate/phosphonate transport system substrate-binding protein